MSPKTAYTIYFSPTGTTRTVVERIADASSADLLLANTVSINLTPAASRNRPVVDLSNGFAVIGTPVYGGRVPPEAASRLRLIRSMNMPAAIVVVYGNRAYEDALVELI